MKAAEIGAMTKRPAVEMREVPPIDKGPLPPAEFVKHWTAMFGNFADGKIDKSKVMLPGDLTKADAEYLIKHGVTVAQIATQYSMSDDEITNKFIAYGLIPKAKIEVPVVVSADEIWFEGETYFRGQSNKTPTLRISKNCINLNTTLGRAIGDAEYVQFGVVNNQVKMKVTDKGYKLYKIGVNSLARRTSCAGLTRHIESQGVKIPAAYKMTIDDSGVWIGVLIDGQTEQ